MTPFEHAARDHAASLSRGSRDLYLAHLAQWLGFCERETIDPGKPTRAAATKFRDELGLRVAPSTLRNTCMALSALYSNALDDEGRPIVAWNPFKKLRLPPAVKHGLTEIVSKATADAILALAASDARDHALLQILYTTGLRVSSAVTILRTDLFEREGQYLLHVTVKGGKLEEVELTPETVVAIGEWLAKAPASKYLFPARGGAKPLDTKAVNKRFNFYAREAGVGHVHPHQFRATFITNALESGVPLHEVQAAVHHEDPKTTLRYHRGVRGAGVSAAVARARRGD